jgi:hypothetical protein
MEWFLVESLPKLPRFKPREAANTLWALATLDHRPTAAWMDQLLAVTRGPRLVTFQPRELTSVIWSLAKLNYHPGDAWVAGFLAASRPRLPGFQAAELAATARALCKLGAAPSAEWVEALAAAVEAQFGSFDAAGALAALAALRSFSAAAAVAGEGAAVMRRPAAVGGDSEAATAFVHDPALPRVVVVVGGEWTLDRSSGSSGDDWAMALIEDGSSSDAGSSSSSSNGSSSSSSRSSLSVQEASSPRSMLLRRLQHGQQPQQAPVMQRSDGARELAAAHAQASSTLSVTWVESFVAEVHGMAALMSLMPDWLRARMRRWPQAWAAQRLALGDGGGVGGGGGGGVATADLRLLRSVDDRVQLHDQQSQLRGR